MKTKTKKKKKKTSKRKTSYRAMPNCIYTDEQAQEIGDGIEVIRHFHGGEVTPPQLVEFAEKRSSKLHKYFEWDDETAAKKHRLEQARYMLRVVCVLVDTTSGPQETRAFVSIKSHEDNKRKYTNVAEAIADEDYREQIIADAVKMLTTWRNKYAQYKEFRAVVNAVDRLKL